MDGILEGPWCCSSRHLGRGGGEVLPPSGFYGFGFLGGVPVLSSCDFQK